MRRSIKASVRLFQKPMYESVQGIIPIIIVPLISVNCKSVTFYVDRKLFDNTQKCRLQMIPYIISSSHVS